MRSGPFVSAIIPVCHGDRFLRKVLASARGIGSPPERFEMLVAGHKDDKESRRIVETEAARVPFELRYVGCTSGNRSARLNAACAVAHGEILAFVDDDAYPAEGWLREAARHFREEEVAAVGGPAVTPESDGLLQKAGGWVYSSFMGGGTGRLRYIPMEQRDVDDYPSCNFIIRKPLFQQLGGFSTSFWPGEDTKLCLDITNKLHKRIVYDPEVLVYHHRRKLFIPHLRQVWSYAVHRGYFVKKFPQTSLRASYFLPSILLLGLVSGILASFFSPIVRAIFLSVLALYLLLAAISSFQSKDIRLIPLVFPGIISTHLTYGAGFIKGLLTRELAR